MKYIADTNVLLDKLDALDGYDIVILSHVLRELDKHKSNRDKPELAYQARRATRFIKENRDRFTFDLKDYKWVTDDQHESGYVDNMIIQACLDNGYGLITDDLNLEMKAEGYGIPFLSLEDQSSSSSMYTGFKEIEVFGEAELAEIYEDDTNKYGLLMNQYLIVKYKDEYQCTRYNGKYLVEIDLPPKRVVTPQNAHQACALDLLWNKDIPIKIIAGTYGSGKTFLSVKAGLEYVNGSNSRKHYSKMMIVRNPIGSGEAIGYLKGTKEDKTEDFYKPIIQHLNNGEFEAQQMEAQGKLFKEIPYYMKGLSINDTFILVDEAEDLNLKLIKLVGTRLGDKSCIVFSGDFNQAEEKYLYNNGLYISIEKLKGNPLVGIVCLQEDIRSDASKVFAEL